jgi:hypothetical protein
MNETPNQTAYRRRWAVYSSYLAAFGMVVCFAATFIQFIFWLIPGLDERGMLVACALTALEAFISFWLVRHLPTAEKQLAFYRVTEFAILLVALKVFAELRAGPESFLTNVILWPVQFPFYVLNGRYLLTLLPALASWQAANLLAGDLSLLGLEEASLPNERTKATPLRVLIIRRFLGLGMIVVLLAGIPPQTAIPTPLPVASNSVPAVVIYFVLGLVLVSLTRYVNLETTWWLAKLQVPGQIPRRWFLYSALILALLIVLISFLPTNYELGLLSTFMAVFRILNQVMFYLYGLVLLLAALLARLIGKPPAVAPDQIPAVTPPPALTPGPVSTINWDLVKSVFLWGSLIILAVIALRQYIAFNQDLSEDIKRFRPFHWLLISWGRFKASFKKANKSIGKFIQNSLERLRRVDSEPGQRSEWDFINPRKLSPRQKIIFYYLALIRRAKEAGLPRQDDQTPYEYAGYLKSSLKGEKGGVDAMTESFIEARYSRHEIQSKQASRSEMLWGNIRQVLRKVRRSGEDKTNDN